MLQDNAYDWRDIVKLTPSKALDNADSHMYLDVLAELEGRHYRLSEVEADARKGVIVFDEYTI